MPEPSRKSRRNARTRALSRRERQIMDIIYAAGRATASEVRDQMPDAPSYSAVRAMLRILEEKGHLRHEQDGPRYIYLPVVSRDTASRSALEHLVETFFDGSTQSAVAALLDLNTTKLSPEDLDRLSKMIDEARKEGH